jgi:hypothetical protein
MLDTLCAIISGAATAAPDIANDKMAPKVNVLILLIITS